MVTYGVAQVVSAVTPPPLSDQEPFPFETSSQLYPEYGLLAGLSMCHAASPRALSPSLSLLLSLSRARARSLLLFLFRSQSIVET
jgi:hypothetical protein